jgi:GNAT superfamily N-acetyltransferase
LVQTEGSLPRRLRYPSFSIVPAILKDAEGIARILKDSFPGEASFYRVRSWETEAKRIMRCHRGWITFIAIDNCKIVGVIAARHLPHCPVSTIRIEWLAVSPNTRGKGIGKALIDHLVDWAFTTFSESQVRLTLRARTHVQDFYRKLGFRHFGSGWMKMVAKK